MKIIIWFFLACVGVALYLNATVERKDIQTDLFDNDRPKISMHNLFVLTYNEDKLRSSIYFSRGDLLESGMFYAKGGVKGIRYDVDQPTNMVSENATVQFLSSDLDRLFAGPEYNEAVFEKNFKLQYAGLTMYGDVVYYDNINKLFYTSKAVRIKGIGQMAESRDGFVYNIREDHLTMKGRVEGVFDPR